MFKHCNEQKKNPIYVVRYEDLLANKKSELEGVMKFLLGVESLEGTNAERRIEEICGMDQAKNEPYRLKNTTGKFNVHAHKYTAEQIEHIKNENAELLYFLGYTNHPEVETKTNFFEFADHKPEHLQKYMGFKEINKKVIEDVSKPDFEFKNYEVNKDECFDWMPDAVRVQEPARTWAARKLGYEKDPKKDDTVTA